MKFIRILNEMFVFADAQVTERATSDILILFAIIQTYSLLISLIFGLALWTIKSI